MKRLAASAAAVAAAAVTQAAALSVSSSSSVFLSAGSNASIPPTEHDYNEETDIPMLPFSVEFFFASVFVLTMASVPAILVVLIGEGELTRAHKIESGALLVWLVTALFLFTNVLKFNSSHWTGARPLTLVEAVYLLSQILTTVGYGDITPALPRGQVWVAINVIIALCLYGSLIMEVAHLLANRVEKMFTQPPSEEAALSQEELRRNKAEQPLKEWNAPPPPIDVTPLIKWSIAFAFFATCGVLFYHYFPGEEKTWLQAVYMSIITLSTVGFGFFNAVTEGGKVFGAFWMLLGVASLAGVIGSFVELMMVIKAHERRDVAGEKLEFYRLVKLCCRPMASLGDNGMERYDFLKFGVMLQGIVTEEEVAAIEARFEELVGADGKVKKKVLRESDGPPTALLRTPRKMEDESP